MKMYYSGVDSERFSKVIHRGVVSSVDAHALNAYINENQVDLLILRVPVELSEDLYKLHRLNKEVLLTDTLVYYTCNLRQKDSSPLKNELVFVEADETNKHIIAQMIPVIFKEYKNHYTSNPSLDRDKITKGYVEWATGFIRAEDKQKISWIVFRNDIPVGFATCSVDTDSDTCEGVLYGVLPAHSGGGVYSDIIRFTQSYYRNQGIKLMKVSTQIQNFAVQKVWAREGFTLNEAFYTFHISGNDTI